MTRFPGLPGDDGGPIRSPGRDADETLAVLLPLLILLSTLLFLLLLFILFLILVRKKRGIVLIDEHGPLNLEDEDEIEGEGGLEGIEERWLEQVEPATRLGYERAKIWQQQYPPNSDPTDITLSQFLTIQEKGISAWSFEPDYESNSAVFVQGRTEISFLADGTGMSGDEGGGCCVQSNLPVPKVNETYYFECKLYEKPQGTNVSIGLSTKPYPTFRLPGWNKYSVAYFSADGFKSHSYPFTGQSYGPPLLEGDVLGVGYRPRTGTVFFTRNGKKLEDAYTGLTRFNLFPTIGATGQCEVHVNLGQAGFVFIEANVKKWGLAPAMGTLAPPPAYGSERGSILLASAAAGTPSSSSNPPRPNVRQSAHRHRHRTPRTQSYLPPTPPSPTTAAGAVSALSSTQPARPSPLRHSRQHSSRSAFSTESFIGSSAAAAATARPGSARSTASSDGDSEGQDRNPPTPGLLDISLQSIHRFPQAAHDHDSDSDEPVSQRQSERRRRRRPTRQRIAEAIDDDQRTPTDSDDDDVDDDDAQSEETLSPPPTPPVAANSNTIVEPPAYHPVDPYMYAPGVAEALLEDSSYGAQGRAAFASPAGSSVASDSRYEATTAASGNSAGSSWWNWLSSSRGPSSLSARTAAAPGPSQRRLASVMPVAPAARPSPRPPTY